MESKHTFNNLRSRRKMLGYTLKQIAFLLELPDTSRISRWERGISKPMLKEMMKLAIIYGTSCDSLYMDYRNELRERINRRHKDMLSKKIQ